MSRLKKLTSVSISLCFLATMSMGFLAGASAQSDEERMVSSVEIQGNETVSQQTISSQLRTAPGRPVSARLLSEDLKRLYGLGYFRDVQIKQDTDADGVKITFVVQEKPILAGVEVKGNSKIDTKKIQDTIRAKPGVFYDEQMIRRDLDAIAKLYEEKGYYEARISHTVDIDPSVNQVRLSIQVDEGAKLVVRRIEFEGAQAIAPAALSKRIQTKSEAWWGLVSGLLKEDILDLDVQRIRAFYDENGYSDAAVSYRIENLEKENGVRVVFVIDEGRQYLVGNLSVEGNNVFSSEEIAAQLPLKSGSPFSRQGLRESVSKIQDLYFEKGYMNARVVFDSLYNDTTQHVDTIYKIKEGNITLVNQVKVRGNSKTKDIVIRRELRVYPGEPFNGAALKRSKERLFNLGYFDEVQFDTEDTANPDEKDLVVSVKEAKTGEFSFGGGFSSVDKALGFVQIRQRNFDAGNWQSFTGAGQDLVLRLQIGSVRSQGEISWTDPWFMGYPFSFGFDLYRRELNRSGSSGYFFDEERTGGRLRLGKEFNDYDRADLFYGYENVNIDNIPDDASSGLRAEVGETALSRAGLTLTRDTTDNKYVPTEGYRLQGGVENVGGFLGGDRDFWRATGSAAGYWEQWEDFVLELKGRVGISDAYGDSTRVPIFERFYAGGANTVRGYRERRIGPRDSSNNDPVGGESYWVGNAEYSFPLVPGIIKGAAFYDLGSVSEMIEDFGSGDVYQGVGLGVRIKTPIGPVKVDAGYPLDDIDGEDKKIRFYFNMSRGF
ncbi:MAG: outer membrane protein assembly factor BamA [Candidatus Omnitrophica bacterium]|nr:outer membrane protein assembly factor BamA [Candidatus Omnitrophota bacterium]